MNTKKERAALPTLTAAEQLTLERMRNPSWGLPWKTVEALVARGLADKAPGGGVLPTALGKAALWAAACDPNVEFD